MTVLYLVALFVANSWVSYGLVLAFLITAVSLSRIRPKTLLRGMKPIVIIVVLTAVLNLFYTGGDHVLARFWGITITWEESGRRFLWLPESSCSLQAPSC